MSFVIKLSVVVALLLFVESNGVALTTRASIRGVDSKRLHNFLATPSNWPTFVASSVAVEGLSSENLLEKVRKLFMKVVLVVAFVRLFFSFQNDAI